MSNNVLACFDGHSGGRIAFEVLGITPGKYYASEVDKYAIEGSMAVFPNTIQLGDITRWREWTIDWCSLDWFIGGSPCQGFSMAGKMAGTTAVLNGEKIVVDSREKYLYLKSAGAEFLSQSYLFWEYILCLDFVKMCNPKIKFFLENVKMKKDFLDLISNAIGVEPIFINSALVSAQNRQRYYWCNWCVEQPEDKGIVLADILESEPFEKTVMSDKFTNRNKDAGCLRDDVSGKAKSLSAMEYVKNGRQGDYIAIQRVATASDIKGHDYNKRIYSTEGKSPSLTAASGGNLEPKIDIRKKSKCVRSSGRGSYDRHEWDSISNCHYRKLTPRECGRLQTIPEDILDTLLKAGISNSQLYKMFGNGWTVDVISHIFKQGIEQ